MSIITVTQIKAMGDFGRRYSDIGTFIYWALQNVYTN